VHGGGLSEVDGVDRDDDAAGAEDGGASGLSVLMTGAEGFGISATEGGLRPAVPISVAPMGMPTGPTGDPGVDVPAVAAAAAPPPIGAQGPDALAVVPPPPALAPMPPPSNVALPEAPVVALVTAAEVVAAGAPPNWITADGSAGPSGQGGFMAEPGRYHLYVSLACPWAHRTLIFRALKRLEDAISLSVVHWLMGKEGWTFDESLGVIPDSILGVRRLYESQVSCSHRLQVSFDRSS
jgi:Glutathione S-transferase, N-terminal domain